MQALPAGAALRACKAMAINAAAAEYQVDADEQADGPGRRGRKTRENHEGQDEIDEAAEQHHSPASRQFALVLERIQRSTPPLRGQERGQDQA